MSPKSVKDLIRAFKRNMEFTNIFSRRRRTASGAENPNAERRVRKSVFTERFDLTDFGRPDLETDNNHEHTCGKKEETLDVDDVAELPLLQTTEDAATPPASQPQPQPLPLPLSIITNEDPNIISGTFSTNTAWLRENLPDLLPPEFFLPHEIIQSQSQSEKEAEMGKKKSTSQAARRQQAKIAKGANEKSSMPATPTPHPQKGPDATQGPAPSVEAKDKQAVQDHITSLLKTTVPKTTGSGAKVAESVTPGAAGPSSGTQPAKEILVVDPELFDVVTDIGVFTKWKRSDFLNLTRNDLLVFIHLYSRDKLPKAEDTDGQVRRVFFNEVYGKYYWISWVRDIIIAFLRNPSATEMAGEETLATLKVAAEDIDFLEHLAPEFKGLCQERLAQYNAQRIEALEGEGQGTGMPKENPSGISIDLSVGATGGKKNKKKGKGKEKEVEGGGEEAASRPPQVLEVKDIDGLVAAFAAALLRSCS
ncbi:hypothetical protein TWF506_005424 [Arthrobotrys conoides]|uniref:Uncharacterized protein n=1 Tax=Arthrobotrys conoides TaxID=74498 RepID=A0AAN8S007_9PEZI